LYAGRVKAFLEAVAEQVSGGVIRAVVPAQKALLVV
jgi:hypothetical protein